MHGAVQHLTRAVARARWNPRLYRNAGSYLRDQALSIGTSPHVAESRGVLALLRSAHDDLRRNRSDSTLVDPTQVAVRRQCMTSAGRFLGCALLGTALISCAGGRAARPTGTGGRDVITQAELDRVTDHSLYDAVHRL